MKNTINCCQFENNDDWKKYCSNDFQQLNDPLKCFNPGDRNINLLKLLSDSENIEVTFQGLKRKLGWHQEILSRTLKRLEQDKLIIRTSTGSYRLNIKLNTQSYHEYSMFQDGGIPVTQLWIPPNLNSEIIISKLKNTWFGNWRWYSFKDGKSEKNLTWISEDGKIWINLRFRDNVIFIESGPVGIIGREKCIYSGYEMLTRLMRVFNNKITESKKLLQTN